MVTTTHDLPAFARRLGALLDAAGPRGRRGVPLVVWGEPGVGKTAVVEGLAADRGWALEVVIGSLRDPTDFAGLPLPDGEGGVRLAAPAWARRLHAACAEGRGGILFLDELSTAPPAVQAAMLRVLAEGVVGELVLPPSVRIVAAANPPELAAGGWGLAAPTANRLLHLKWSGPSAPEWATWLEGQAGLDPRVRAGIAGFARRRPDLLLAVPKTEEGRGGAWPSPRSWESAARALAAVKAAGLGEAVALEVLAAAVGQGAANEAWAHLVELDLPDPEDLLAGRVGVPLEAARRDRTHAALAAVVAAALDEGGRSLAARAERAVTALELATDAAAKGAADAAAAVAGDLIRRVGADKALATAWAGKRQQAALVAFARSGVTAAIAEGRKS